MGISSGEGVMSVRVVVRICQRADQGALCLGWVILEEEAQIAMSGGKCGQALAWEQACGIKVSGSAKSRTCEGNHSPW